MDQERAAAADIDLQNALGVMARELEGIEAVRTALLGELGQSLSRAVDLLYGLSGRLIVTGIGKSGNIGRKIASTLASTGTPTYFVHPSDAGHGDMGMLQTGDVVLAMSWSGETAELLDIVSYTRRNRIPLIAITSNPQSALGHAADLVLALPSVIEAGPYNLVPTVSTTTQLVLGDVLAVCLLQRRNFTARDFTRLHPAGRLGAHLFHVRDIMHTGDRIPLVSAETTVAKAISEIIAKGFGVTGVIDSCGKIVGVLSDGDACRAFDAGAYDRRVIDVVRREPQLTSADALLEQALAQLRAARTTHLFAVEQDKPVGVITLHDILRIGTPESRTKSP
jgi:arabinose-5-phosphate isomerase